MNILIKLSTIVALIIAPHIARKGKIDMKKLNTLSEKVEYQHHHSGHHGHSNHHHDGHCCDGQHHKI